jgi:hypothetical protein
LKNLTAADKYLTAADKYLTAAVKIFENFTVAGFFLYGKNIFLGVELTQESKNLKSVLKFL